MINHLILDVWNCDCNPKEIANLLMLGCKILQTDQDQRQLMVWQNGCKLVKVDIRDGLFGKFSAQQTQDPSNPGCSGGPRSITVVTGQRNSNININREITASICGRSGENFSRFES